MKILLFITTLATLAPLTNAADKNIKNASESAMPVERTQRISSSSSSRIYTARAKSGYCFAVKKGRIAYMSIERANKLEAKTFRYSHQARRHIAASK